MRKETIVPADITAAIAARLASAFPGEPVYTDLVPRDFQRPSNMVELAGLSLDPLAHGQSGVGLLYQYKITTFSTVDEVHPTFPCWTCGPCWCWEPSPPGSSG